MKSARKTQIATPPPADPDALIDCNAAAKLLCLAPVTVRMGRGGTETLNRVRVPSGTRTRVLLLEAEVRALRSDWIAKAKARGTPQERALRLIEGMG